MSFRDNSNRYGYVPPAQYATTNSQASNIDRRQSFNQGDDGAHYTRQAHSAASPLAPQSAAGSDELFLNTRATYNQPSALSGYHHRYQDPNQPPPIPSHAAYNPQHFATQGGFQRSQSTQLPYHGHTNRRLSLTPSHSFNAASVTSPASYTPQGYNPAAYAAGSAPQRHPTYHGAGYNQEQGYGAPRPPSSYAQSPASTAYSPQPSPALSQGLQSPVYASANGGYNSPHYQMSGQYVAYNSNGGTNDAPFSPASQSPYPATSQMPPAPNYANQDQTSFYSRSSRSNSQSSPVTSPPVQSQLSPGLQRHPTRAPLPSRPMDEVPEESRWGGNSQSYDEDPRYANTSSEGMMQEIEAELDRISPGPSPRRPNGRREDGPDGQLHRYGSTTSSLDQSSSHVSPRRAFAARPEEVDDDDDPEGTAGVLAMQQAELDDQRFSSNAFGFADMPAMPPLQPHLQPHPEEQTNGSDGDSDLGGMDLGMLSGGYAGNLTYGASPPAGEITTDSARPLPTPGAFPAPADVIARNQMYHNAEIDYGDTGGLQAPRTHRMSFDEGDEQVSLHSKGPESPNRVEHPDLPYHPGIGLSSSISSRPLPRVPPGPGSDSSSMLSVNTSNRNYYHQQSTSMSGDSAFATPADQEGYRRPTSPLSPYPERSISMNSHSNTPQVLAPARSRTDAAEERKKLHRQHQMITGPSSAHPDLEPSASSSVGAFDGITLPSARKKKFIPSKLSAGDFKKCALPWALSGIEAWIRDMAEGEPDLREKTLEQALINLFVHKVPKMNVADAEALSSYVVKSMLDSGTLEPDEEWVKLGPGHISGVLWQMTGSGCYAPKVHTDEFSGRCYSYHCSRMEKKVDLQSPDSGKGAADWMEYYGLSTQDLESKDRKEIERQNILHEIVTGEGNSYIKDLETFRTMFRDDLGTRNPPVLHPDRRDKFLAAVFGKIDSVLKVNKDNLLPQLKYRQQEQGPWITGFSDIFREWIRKAKTSYIEYAVAYPRAVYMVRKESERNLLFKRFLEEKLKDKAFLRQDWTHFLILPLTRLQRYILLLESVEKKMKDESEEKTNVQKAIAEIKAVTTECDVKVDETNKRVQMMELDRMLVLRPGFQSVLNLDHMGRVLIIQGDLQRMGSKSVRWIDTHALLFDHYLILAKVVKDQRGERKYDVSKEPIPMPLLFLESMNDEPIVKQKGLTAPLGRNVAAAPSSQLSKVNTNGSGRPGLEHQNTGSSLNSGNDLTQTNSNSDEKILYPFRVKHLGHEVYTLYAATQRDRMEWCTKIVEAKERHAKALYSQNAEPFRLRVLADVSFNYPDSSPHIRAASVHVRGTPLDRAIEDLESILGSGRATPPVCRTQVNCAAGFTAFGKPIIAIGTDNGVYITDPSNPRGWTRTLNRGRVTQIAVLEEFSVCLLVLDRQLESYPLDVITPISDFATPANDSLRRAPQKLSKDVTYFATGKMKDRSLVFFKRRENLHTTFKVLEPIMSKSNEKRRLFGGRRGGGGGATETFRDYDEFFFPTECYSLSLFQSYIAVSTAKGVEMLTLDKKQPMSIPDLKAPNIANIASRIRDQKPLGMFKLNDNEFILTYEDCAVYVDKHGDVSRTLIMEYTGKQKKARGATMYGQYLLLFNDDYVEVRNAENGRLRQIIAGRDVRVLDYGVRGPTGGNAAQWEQTYGRNGGHNTLDASKGTVKIAMSHPELQGRQIVLEMLLNDGHTES